MAVNGLVLLTSSRASDRCSGTAISYSHIKQQPDSEEVIVTVARTKRYEYAAQVAAALAAHVRDRATYQPARAELLTIADDLKAAAEALSDCSRPDTKGDRAVLAAAFQPLLEAEALARSSPAAGLPHGFTSIVKLPLRRKSVLPEPIGPDDEGLARKEERLRDSLERVEGYIIEDAGTGDLGTLPSYVAVALEWRIRLASLAGIVNKDARS